MFGHAATKSVGRSFFTRIVALHTAPLSVHVVSGYCAVSTTVAELFCVVDGAMVNVFGCVGVGLVTVQPVPLASATVNAGAPGPTMKLPSASSADTENGCACMPPTVKPCDEVPEDALVCGAARMFAGTPLSVSGIVLFTYTADARNGMFCPSESRLPVALARS